MKLVEAVTSADIVSLVTMSVAVSSNWNSIPILFAFRPMNYRNYFVARELNDVLDLRTNQGGVAGDNVFYMAHFIKHTRITKEKHPC
jgi:hypothetical protein